MSNGKKLLKVVLWLTFMGTGAVICSFSGIYLYLSPKLPDVESLRQIKLQTPLRVFSSRGALIGEFGEKRRTPIAIQDTPKAFIDAILSAEDDGFYTHSGVDIKGLLRATTQLVQAGQIKTGGSTITMQVARNFFLTRNQTFIRKFNEILLALQIEKELDKDDILELYINKIYLGNRSYGIQAASLVYYGKPIDELNLAQLAMIAGLPKAPSAYNPLANPERALIRRNWILGRMLSLGKIDNKAYQEALSQPVTAAYHGPTVEFHAPYVAEMARAEVIDRLGLKAYNDGYTVYTTIDDKLQQSAQQAVIRGLMTYDSRHGYRGPEANLAKPDLSPTDGLSVNDETAGEWITQLQDYPQLGGLTAAVVLQVNPDSIDAALRDGTRFNLSWEQGLADARSYLDENRRGPKPLTASDLLTAGDVIRVIQTDDSWRLSQVPAAQAALIALNPENGAIQAMSGGFDFQQSHFNRVIQAKRQPGSNFKPFIYTAALEHGLTAASLINDAPIVLDDASLEGAWRPENASGKFFGPTRLRKALYRSRNLVSIRVLRQIGIDNALAEMDRFGFDHTLMPKDLSLALGSYAVTPLEVATGYAVFANGGFQVSPYLVERIEDSEGNIVYQADPATVCRECETENQDQPDETSMAALEAALAAEFNEQSSEPEPPAKQPNLAPRVLSAEVAYLMDSMLKDVITKGTGRKARALQRNDLAGKTGTTNGPRDAWFSGYNPHIVATTWLGFDDNSMLGRREYGGTSALPIWIDFMKTALNGVPEQLRPLPAGLATVRIDPATGLRTESNNPDAIFEMFRVENIPPYNETNASELPYTSGERNTLSPEELF